MDNRAHAILMLFDFLWMLANLHWATRKVLTWLLSNTMDMDFCVMALDETLMSFGATEMFNADQGSQFTTFAFNAMLKHVHIRISMDGCGRWMDNVLIERVWRFIKNDLAFLYAFNTGTDQRAWLTGWIGYYDADPPRSKLVC